MTEHHATRRPAAVPELFMLTRAGGARHTALSTAERRLAEKLGMNVDWGTCGYGFYQSRLDAEKIAEALRGENPDEAIVVIGSRSLTSAAAASNHHAEKMSATRSLSQF